MNNSLDLMNRDSRKKDRVQKIPKSLAFSHEEIKIHFRENIKYIEDSLKVLDNNKLNKEDEANILRSRIMFLDSAIDFYMHEITKYGMKKMFDGQWKRNDKYLDFKINLDTLHTISELNEREFFNDVINKSISSDTFMDFNSIKKQLNMIGLDINVISRKVFYEKGDNASPINKLKDFLNSLYYRRNRIAHQSDRDPATGRRGEIDRDFVKININTVIGIVSAIDDEIVKKDMLIEDEKL